MAGQHPIHPHHQERLLLFQGLFMMDVGGLNVKEALVSLREFSKSGSSAPMLGKGKKAAPAPAQVPAAGPDYVRVERELAAVKEKLGEIDLLIGKHTQNWRFERLARVERNVLRLGTFELLQNEEPFQIIISEAIDLAHEFGDDKSGGFVNGVLDAVWRTVGKTGEPIQE